jgi:hypothetical protein
MLDLDGHVLLGQLEKSAVTKRSLETGHSVDCHNTTSLDKETEHIDRLMKEAIEIRFRPVNFNRDGILSLNLINNQRLTRSSS